MKKIATVIIFIASVWLYSNAQDTLSTNNDRYLYMDKPELVYNNYGYGTCGVASGRITYNRIYLSDSVKVFGIAVNLGNFQEQDHRNVTAVLFRTHDTASMFMDTTSLISARNHFVYEYWHEYTISNGITHLDSAKYDTVPIYEFYFDSAITVHDTFYVGVFEKSHTNPQLNIIFNIAIISEEWNADAYDWWWQWNDQRWYHVTHGIGAHWGGIFPIIKPLHDTADSTGVWQVAATNSVRVEPNPTHGSVSVRTAEGLRRVEFYDMTGLRTLSREATGTETRIDIAAMPAGIYVVRVHTTTGTVSRKLVVM